MVVFTSNRTECTRGLAGISSRSVIPSVSLVISSLQGEEGLPISSESSSRVAQELVSVIDNKDSYTVF